MGVSVLKLGEAVGLSVAGASCTVHVHVKEGKKWWGKGVMVRAGTGWPGGYLGRGGQVLWGQGLESGGAGW